MFIDVCVVFAVYRYLVHMFLIRHIFLCLFMDVYVYHLLYIYVTCSSFFLLGHIIYICLLMDVYV